MISYNLTNEYIEKLIKLGITPDDIKQATESDIPHLYEYHIYDSDTGFMLLLPVDLENIYISINATDLTTKDKEVLTKIYNNLNIGDTKYANYSDNNSWLPFNVYVRKCVDKLLIRISCLNDTFDTLECEYQFNVINGKVESINTIRDNTFNDGLNIEKVRQLF